MRAVALTTAGNLRVMADRPAGQAGHSVGHERHAGAAANGRRRADAAVGVAATPGPACPNIGRPAPSGGSRQRVSYDVGHTERGSRTVRAERPPRSRRRYIRSIMALPKPEHDTCVAPGIRRAKS